MTDERRHPAALTPAQRRLYERRLAQRERQAAARPGATRARAGPGPHPLSFAQERFWFLDQLEPDSPESNMTGAGRFRGPLDAQAMANALTDLAERQAVLRTHFPAPEGQPAQVILPATPVELPLLDLAGLPAQRREREVRERAREFAQRPFDLRRGAPLRALLVRLAPDDHALFVGQHHAISDGWSLWILMEELSAAYNARRQGLAPTFSPLPLRYVDYAAWQRERLQGARLAPLLEHWREALRDAPTGLELPLDHARPKLVRHAGEAVRFELNAARGARLRSFAKARGVTPYEVLLAAFNAFLARLCRSEDIVLGTSVSGRARPEFAGLMGAFVNTLVLRTRLQGALDFETLLERSRDVSRAAGSHAELPFERLVEELAPERDPGRTPLFNVFFDMAVPYGSPEWNGLEFEEIEFERGIATFDLSLSFEERGERLLGAFEFNAGLFERASVERMRANFELLLAGLLAEPTRAWQDIDWIAPDERARLAAFSAPSARQHRSHELVHQRFARRAAERPHDVAVEDGARRVTYGQLEQAANRWARALVDLGAGPEQRVAVCLPRSADALIALLALWKAGAAYVPLDVEDPPARWAERLRTARPVALISDLEHAGRLPSAAAHAQSLLCMDAPPEGLAGHAPGAPPVGLEPQHLAYVLFTSGSTGEPKGVAVEHAALVNHLEWVRGVFDLKPSDRFLLRTPFGFDASLWEIVHPLSTGATLVVAPQEVGSDAGALLQLAAEARISVAQTVPSLLRTWLAEPAFEAWSSLRHLVSAGEALDAKLWRSYRAHSLSCGRTALLHNLYGPSEACIDATACSLDPALDELEREQAPIGRPIDNTRAYVLDERRAELPIGVVGELWLAGAGLARGYWQDPARTRASFVDLGDARGRAYRTGDLVRWLPSGELEFLGRADRQLKLRGVRIEPGEIEACLRCAEGVQDAAVLPIEGPQGTRLAAFCCPAPGMRVDTSQLLDAMRARLPRGLVPASVHVLERMPLNSSEKLDHRALEALASAPPSSKGSRRAPSTRLEVRLASLFEELLEVPDVACEDDFFALGGHSLLAARLIARLRAEDGLALDLVDFFDGPSVGRLARRLEAIERTGAHGSELPTPSPAGADGPQSFFQERLAFLQRLDPGSSEHNVTGALRLTGLLDPRALAAAWERVLERQEVLRSTLHEDGLVRVLPSSRFRLERHEASPSQAPEHVARRLLERESAHVFELERGPLARLVVSHVSANEHVLCLNVHHAVADGWSLELLTDELAEAYSARVLGRPERLPELPFQYRDWAAWERERATPERLEPQLAHWRNVLADAPPQTPLPHDHAPRSSTRRGARHRFELDAQLLGDLRALAREHGLPLYPLLLAGFAATLSRTGSGDDLVIGTAVAQRPRVELERLIGPLLNALPLRLDLSGEPGLAELAVRAGATCAAAWANQDVPFERLVRELVPERSAGRFPLFQASCDLHSFPERAARFEGLEGDFVEFDPGTAKLDLALSFEHDGERLAAMFEYDRDLFEPRTVRDLARHLVCLLRAGCAAPELDVQRLPMGAASEPDACAPTTPHELLLERFERHVRRAPAALAIECGTQRWSYVELQRLVAVQAAGLAARGVRAGDLVAVCVERSARAVALMLALWKLGAAWLHIESTDPPERRDELRLQAQCSRLILDQEATASDAADTIALAELEVPAPHLESRAQARAEDLAYVVATSGSSGAPKLVAIEQRALAHRVAAASERYGFAASDRISQVISLGFDASLLEVASALGAGAGLVIAPPTTVADPHALVEFLVRHEVSVCVLPVALLTRTADVRSWAGARNLRLCLTGGEPLGADVPARLFRWLDPARVSLYDSYGPSETCIEVSSHRCKVHEVSPVPVGQELPGVRACILDRDGRPLPPGLVGELCLGGAGLQRGYLGQPQLTRAASVEDPWRSGARLHRSGDLARRREDGELVLLGRLDDEVKVAGRRLRPAALEGILASAPGVEAVALEARTTGQELRLVGHVAFSSEARRDLVALERHARARLPEGWVPRRWRVLPSLPRTAHGKLDRRLLAEAPHSEFAAAVAVPAVPARNELERELCRRFATALGREPRGVHEDFFAAGGGSLGAMAMVSQLAREHGTSLGLSDFYERPTVAGLAAQLTGGHAPSASVDLEAEVEGRLDLPSRIPRHVGGDRPHVLLTGATGFLGSYLLEALLRAGATRVTCLVRADDDERARERLLAALQSRGVAPAVDPSRIEVLAADLAQPRLGLDEATWKRLARELDQVLHCGAVVHFFERYAGLAAANVDGTHQLLGLAAQRGLPFHHVSTIGVVGSQRGPACEVGEDDPLPDPDHLEWGYEQSKWVAERLVVEAGKRGLPVSVHRPGRIAGHSRSGVWNADDLAARMIAGMVQLGAVPDLDARLDVTPVDWVADGIAHLCTLEPSGRVYHFTHPRPTHFGAVFELLRERGHQLQPLGYARWVAAAREAVHLNPTHALAPLVALAGEDDDPARLLPDLRLPRLGRENLRRDVEDAGWTCPAIDRPLLTRWIQHLERAGLLPSPSPDHGAHAPDPRPAPRGVT